MKFAAMFDYVHPDTQNVLVKDGEIFDETTFTSLVELGFNEFYIIEADSPTSYNFTFIKVER